MRFSRKGSQNFFSGVHYCIIRSFQGPRFLGLLGACANSRYHTRLSFPTPNLSLGMNEATKDDRVGISSSVAVVSHQAVTYGPENLRMCLGYPRLSSSDTQGSAQGGGKFIANKILIVHCWFWLSGGQCRPSTMGNAHIC